MNGGADLGGMQGFGPVVQDGPDDGHYHADWESRVMGMVVALGACGKWNIDQSRHARESLSPADYLTFPYYRIWLEAAETLLLERGMISKEELEAARANRPASLSPAADHKGPLTRDKVWDGLHSLAGAADRPHTKEAGFQVGDKVTCRNIHPQTHTRLPRYVRGKTGVISAVLGHHVFPDESSKGNEAAGWLYQVRFTAQELWGAQANPKDNVTLDLWEPYFE